jgi:hypothetical protein
VVSAAPAGGQGYFLSEKTEKIHIFCRIWHAISKSILPFCQIADPLGRILLSPQTFEKQCFNSSRESILPFCQVTEEPLFARAMTSFLKASAEGSPIVRN